MPTGRRRPPTAPADSSAGRTGSTHGLTAVPAPATNAKRTSRAIDAMFGQSRRWHRRFPYRPLRRAVITIAARMDEEPSFDLAAAGLRADAPDLAAGLESLARKLEEALPAETRVQRAPKRFLSRKKVVEAIEVRLGDSRYALRVDGGAVDAERHQEVRGVVIKRQELD